MNQPSILDTNGIARVPECDSNGQIDSKEILTLLLLCMPTETKLDRALQAIADPTRRRILLALKEKGTSTAATGAAAGCLCAGDIEERMQLSQPTISHHMAILTKAGLVEATKRGQWRWYRRNEKAIRQVVQMLRGRL